MTQRLEEYFSIYEVNDNKRAAIAEMQLSGTSRSWYKSFMMGYDKVSWHQFTQAFLARFGELDTELVLEAYFHEYENCIGRLLRKIPSLTGDALSLHLP